MLLFFRRDCADGAGPAVEAPSPPVFAASLFAPPDVGAGWVAGADVVPEVEPAWPNRLGAPLVAVPAPDVAGAELPPPSEGNRDGADAVAEVVPVPAVVVVAPVVAGVLLGAAAAGLPMLNKELPPVEAPVLDPAPANKPEGAAEGAGVAELPPKPKDAMLDGGCEDAVAGVAAGVPPRLKDGGLLAGVEDDAPGF
jgi:hypothetical protein